MSEQTKKMLKGWVEVWVNAGPMLSLAALCIVLATLWSIISVVTPLWSQVAFFAETSPIHLALVMIGAASIVIAVTVLHRYLTIEDKAGVCD